MVSVRVKTFANRLAPLMPCTAMTSSRAPKPDGLAETVRANLLYVVQCVPIRVVAPGRDVVEHVRPGVQRRLPNRRPRRVDGNDDGETGADRPNDRDDATDLLVGRHGLRARAEIERLWAGDTTPMVTLTLQAQVEAAVRSGAVVFATDQSGEPLGSFHRCPWPAIYEARRPVTVGGTRVMPMQQFTLDVRAGAQAARGVIVSVFVPTGTGAEPDDDRARRSAPGRR